LSLYALPRLSCDAFKTSVIKAIVLEICFLLNIVFPHLKNKKIIILKRESKDWNRKHAHAVVYQAG
jgi:hypothetical protein